MRINLKRIEASAHFANKLWNGAKFVIGAMDRAAETEPMAAPTIVDEWITAQFGALHADVVRHVEGFQFGEAGRRLHEFLWSEFFDWYVEAAKIRLYSGAPGEAQRAAETLAQVLDGSLRLLHPFMPSLTEEIWHHFRDAGGAPDAPGMAHGDAHCRGPATRQRGGGGSGSGPHRNRPGHSQCAARVECRAGPNDRGAHHPERRGQIHRARAGLRGNGWRGWSRCHSTPWAPGSTTPP